MKTGDSKIVVKESGRYEKRHCMIHRDWHVWCRDCRITYTPPFQESYEFNMSLLSQLSASTDIFDISGFKAVVN